MKNESRFFSRKLVNAAFLVGVFTLFQNCDKVNFAASTAGPSANNITGPVGGGAPIPPVAPAANGNPPIPTDFAQTNCTIPYPYSTSTPATNVPFNETKVLAAFSYVYAAAGPTVNVYYGDEKAMILGISQVNVITASGTVSTSYSVSALPANPGTQASPMVGATALTGDQAGVDGSTCSGAPDLCSRPMFPALFITDTTTNPKNIGGDWQYGGSASLPTSVSGTWKSATRTVDKTSAIVSSSIKVDSDPTANFWNLGSVFPAPTNPASEAGYGAVVSWNLKNFNLITGHTYRLQFMVHDGDENRVGGDVGENCINIEMP